MRILSPLLRSAALACLVLAVSPMSSPITAQTRSGALAFSPEIEKEDYFRPGIAPVRTSAGYDLTIVYFMDYQCPSCRQYTPDVARALAEDSRVRVIYRDTPIISDLSTVAARAAIAASFQGRHDAFHHALMMTKGQLTEAGIRAAAKSAKVDWARLQRDLKSRGEDIDLQIGRNTELAVATGVLGTPAFIVGERLSNGALDYASLRAEIADARGEAAKAGKLGAVAPTEMASAEETNSTVAMPPTAADPAARTTTPPLFRKVEATRKTATEPQSPSNRRGLPLPLLAGLAVLVAIGGGWLVQRRKAAQRG